MRYNFVTSMSLRGYEEYGATFLETFNRYCTIPITVYSEDILPVPTVNLNSDGLKAFLDESPTNKDYRWDAGKFAKKVFAITDPFIRKGDWLIWIDADVVVFDWITETLLRNLCPDYATGSYLGRKDWHHSECGFVAYNLREGAGEFLDRFREVYTSGEIFSYLQWHDSYIFDRVREEGWNFVNLSKGVPGMHVWDGTLLGSTMKHLKGPLRKKGKTADIPNYWSEKESAV